MILGGAVEPSLGERAQVQVFGLNSLRSRVLDFGYEGLGCRFKKGLRCGGTYDNLCQ